MERKTGKYEHVVVGDEMVSAFVPYPLPPTDPPLVFDSPLADRLRNAEKGLARLDLAGEMVPSLDWFISAFVRKETVISSRIEGTQASLVDLLRFEALDNTSPSPDVEEICNHLDALAHVRQQITTPHGLPLSMRLLNETHRILMRGVHGIEKGIIYLSNQFLNSPVPV